MKTSDIAQQSRSRRSGAKVRRGGECLQKSHGHWQQIKHTFSTTSANTHHSFIKKIFAGPSQIPHSHSTLIWWVLQLSSNSVYPPRAQPARNLNFDLWRTKVPHDLIVSFDTHNGSHHDLSLLSLRQLSQQRKYVRTNQNKKRRKGRIRHNKKHLFIADASSLILVQFSNFLFVKPNYAVDSLSWWFHQVLTDRFVSDTSVKIPLYDQWFVCVCVCVCACERSAWGEDDDWMTFTCACCYFP